MSFMRKLAAATDPSAPTVPVPVSTAPEPVGFRDFGDAGAVRAAIYDRTLAAARGIKPVQNARFSLALEGVDYEDPDSHPLARQKEALLKGQTLARRLRGTWVLRDATGLELDRKRSTVASVPHLTDRGTFILNGSEYSLSHQMRLRPGVYTRVKDNGELEAHANVLPGKGMSHRYSLEPETGVFKVQFGQSAMPLLPVLRAYGLTDAQLREAWGPELFAANAAKDDPRVVDKLYKKLVRKADPAAPAADKAAALRDALGKMGFDPEVNRRTLGADHPAVTADTILAVTRKLLALNRGEADPDDRDHLAYQTFLGPEDLISERLERLGPALHQLLWKAGTRGSLKSLPVNALDRHLKGAILDSGLGAPTEEINPLELLDHQTRVSRLGLGGIPSTDSIPDEARAVQPSHVGFVDPTKTPESLAAGVDSRIAFSARKGTDGRLYAPFFDPKTRRQVYKSPQDVADMVLAFPGELETGEPLVRAMVKGRTTYVPRDRVELELPQAEQWFSPVSNLVTFKSASKGQRVSMGSRFLTQALPLANAEAPLVRMTEPGTGAAFAEKYGKFAGAVHAAGQAGRVEAVTRDAVKVRYADGSVKTHELYDNFPYNRKTTIHNTPLVQPGDPVAPGQLLARSNFTDDKGHLAVGLNTRVAYMPWKGANYEDAWVVSQGYADRSASEHLYQHRLDHDDALRTGRKAYVSIFPAAFPKAKLAGIDDDGVVRPGTRVEPGDPLVLAAAERPASHKSVHSAHKGSFADHSVLWDHHAPGVVTDVAKTAKGVTVAVKSINPTRVGDKLAGLHGNKGVIAKIIPDAEMPRDPATGEPYELLANPLGIISRTNDSQLYEAWLGKIARKTGRPVLAADFDSSKDLNEWVAGELARHGLTGTEEVEDPASGRRVRVATGVGYYLKLHHTSESKHHGRGLGAYTADEAPAKGGAEGSKRMALMDVNALLSHGATEVLRDAKLVRGQKNQEYWSAFMSGFRPPTPDVPLVYRKFVDGLRGAGVNVERRGSRLHLMALTDADVAHMSENRELKNVETVDWRDGMKPVEGGLFDTALTGGHGGTKWAHITLAEPLPNPVMEEPIRRLLGLTGERFEAVLAGREDLHGKSGPGAIRDALAKVNVPAALASARDAVAHGRKGARDEAVRRLGYLKACETTGVHPKDWVLSRVPVLPPAFRPVSQMQSGTQLVADANYLYKEVFDANRNLKDLAGKVDDVGDERLTLYNAFKGVTGLGDPVQPKNQERQVKGLLAQVFGDSPKFGTVQQKLLGTTLDLIGRAVVVPNPDLSMDEVGLPEARAWEVYSPFIVRRLVKGGMARVKALEAVRDRTPHARKALLGELDERPVIVNRAPVLHRYGRMAFYPRLVKGDTLQVSPLVVSGYGMDFDGDQQIGSVYASIDRAVLRGLELNSTNSIALEDCAVPFSRNLSVPALDAEADLYLFNLEDFPHAEQVSETRGQFGLVQWFRVPDGIKTLSRDVDGVLRWAKVTLWSKHHGCPVELVDLRSGRQIVTDDDPRGVYGMRPGTLAASRFRPSEAATHHVLVPRVVGLSPDAIPTTMTKLSTASMASYSTGRERFTLRPEVELDEGFGYLVGCAAGDGWAPVTGKDFCLAGITPEVVAKVAFAVTALFTGGAPAPCRVDIAESYGRSTRYSWANNPLSQLIASLIGRGAARKHLPAWFLKAPLAFREGLFAGLMDTDGSISVSRAKAKPQLMANVSSTSLRLLQETHLLAASLGIRGRITPSKTPAGKDFWLWTPSNYDVGVWGGKGMAHPAKLAALAEATPLEKANTLVRHDLVPVSRGLAESVCRAIPTPKDRKLWPAGRATVYSAFQAAKTSGYTTREAAIAVLGHLPDKAVSHADWTEWRRLVADVGVTWEPVAGCQKTGIVEVGYDLTVPGAETFTAADGVILSNTSNYEVPATDEAAKEALEKMLPSRNLLAVSDFAEPMYQPRQEYVGGLHAATSTVKHGKPARVFASQKALMRAYWAGELDPDDPVEVMD